MPMFVNTHGLVITLFVLLHPVVFAFTKLSVVPSGNSSVPATSTHRPHHPNHNTSSTPAASSANNRTGSRMYSARRSRNTMTDTTYPLTGYDSGYSKQPLVAFTYPDFQSTFGGDVSTITYPYITTAQPVRRTVHRHQQHHKPQVTKLYVKPVRRAPGEFSSEEAFDGGIDNDFIPLASFYANGGGSGAGQRWATAPNQYSSQYSYPPKAATAFSSSSSGLSSSGFTSSFTAGAPSAIETIHETSAHRVPIVAELHHSKPKLDLKKIGILALVKVGLAKLKAFGLLKLLFFILLKFKLFLVLIFVKFVLFLKALKLIKALLLPFFLLSLLPLLLLLLPLLLLPLLLPLLLLLPVPVLSPVRDHHARIHMLDYIKMQKTDPLMEIMGQLLDSERCVERIACQLATKKETKLLYPILNWYLKKLSSIIKNDDISSYVDAYTKTIKEYNGSHSEHDGQRWCFERYTCQGSDSTINAASSSRKISAKIKQR